MRDFISDSRLLALSRVGLAARQRFLQKFGEMYSSQGAGHRASLKAYGALPRDVQERLAIKPWPQSQISNMVQQDPLASVWLKLSEWSVRFAFLGLDFHEIAFGTPMPESALSPAPHLLGEAPEEDRAESEDEQTTVPQILELLDTWPPVAHLNLLHLLQVMDKAEPGTVPQEATWALGGLAATMKVKEGLRQLREMEKAGFSVDAIIAAAAAVTGPPPPLRRASGGDEEG